MKLEDIVQVLTPSKEWNVLACVGYRHLLCIVNTLANISTTAALRFAYDDANHAVWDLWIASAHSADRRLSLSIFSCLIVAFSS